jgi:hypothetical protein
VRVITAKICGYKVKIYKRKIKIFDPSSELEDDKAIAIVQYLYDEGFLEEEAHIDCEIINE